MSARKRRTAEEKLRIVLEGLREDTTISEVCRKHGIHASQYYQWRDKLFESAEEIYSRPKKDKEKEQLLKEKESLEKTVVKLSVEMQALKKLQELAL